jgi:hypothetical protein
LPITPFTAKIPTPPDRETTLREALHRFLNLPRDHTPGERHRAEKRLVSMLIKGQLLSSGINVRTGKIESIELDYWHDFQIDFDNNSASRPSGIAYEALRVFGRIAEGNVIVPLSALLPGDGEDASSALEKPKGRISFSPAFLQAASAILTQPGAFERTPEPPPPRSLEPAAPDELPVRQSRQTHPDGLRALVRREAHHFGADNLYKHFRSLGLDYTRREVRQEIDVQGLKRERGSKVKSPRKSPKS